MRFIKKGEVVNPPIIHLLSEVGCITNPTIYTKQLISEDRKIVKELLKK